jgi:hypothetical protein
MKNLFEVKICYNRPGDSKKVTDTYVIDAYTYTEVEARIIEYATPFASGELFIKSIRRLSIADIFRNKDAANWFKAKVVLITFDTVKAIEKRTNITILQQAEDLKSARELLVDNMSGTVSDWEIAKIEATAILEVLEEEIPAE